MEGVARELTLFEVSYLITGLIIIVSTGQQIARNFLRAVLEIPRVESRAHFLTPFEVHCRIHLNFERKAFRLFEFRPILAGRFRHMIEAADPNYLAWRLKNNVADCRRKLKEHQRHALWARQALRSMTPSNDFSPIRAITPPLVQPSLGGTSNAKSQARTKPPRAPSPDPFEEEESFERPESNPIVDDITPFAPHPRSNGNRCGEETRQLAFDLLRACGINAPTIRRDRIPFTSQSLYLKLPDGWARSDLTDLSLVLERVRRWCSSLTGKIPSTDYPGCILACDKAP
jgi:hypothetical protein